jgi:hypothetical protein
MKITGGKGFTGFIKVNCKLSRRQQDSKSLLSLWVQYSYSSFSHDDLVDDKRIKSARMFNMDETLHIATQLHETSFIAQKMKQLGATVF